MEKDERVSDRYKILKRKVITITLLFTIIPLIVLGGVLYYRYSQLIKQRVIEEIEDLAENRKKDVEFFLNEKVLNLQTLANIHSADYFCKPSNLEEVLTMFQRDEGGLVDLGIIDEEGNHVCYAGPYNLLGKDYKDTMWFQNVIVKELYISDVFLGYRDFPHFIIAVKKKEGRKFWILRATVDPQFFYSLASSTKVGEKGDIFIINKEGIYQTPPRINDKILDRCDYLEIPNPFSGVKVKESNGKFLTAMTWLNNGEWVLVVKKDLGEALSSLLYTKYFGLVTFFSGIVAIVTAIFFIVSYLAKQLEKADREKALLDEQVVQSSKLAGIGQLAAGIAHEINNPLAIIGQQAGWMEDLLQDLEKNPVYEEFETTIKKIKGQVDRAGKITHHLLGFLRKMGPVEEKVNINEVLDETAFFLEKDAKLRNIEIVKEYDKNLPMTITDTGKLQQVFLNLISNAIGAINQNGKVFLKTESKDNKMLIAVKDTGPGIAPEILGRIFEPFFTTKKPGEGTGLGLSIIQDIIRKLGGSITVESEVGKGTAFLISLPLNIS